MWRDSLANALNEYLRLWSLTGPANNQRWSHSGFDKWQFCTFSNFTRLCQLINFNFPLFLFAETPPPPYQYAMSIDGKLTPENAKTFLAACRLSRWWLRAFHPFDRGITQWPSYRLSFGASNVSLSTRHIMQPNPFIISCFGLRTEGKKSRLACISVQKEREYEERNIR